MSFELYTLLGAVLLGLVHIAAASFSFKAQVGNAYSVGPRDQDLRPTGIAGRLHRANRNFLETFPYFMACVLVAHLIGAQGSYSQWGCALYLGGRIIYLPLYASGLPWLRSFSWNAATLGLVLVGVQSLITG